MPGKHVGQILWTDLTVSNCEEVRAFYEAVIGWSSTGLEMEGRTDYLMAAPDPRPAPQEGMEKTAAGICHAMGDNAGLPPQWLIYWGVADLDASMTACEKLGGKLISGIKGYGNNRYCVISDPAGAVCAIFEQND
ncbi:VOC family protein [Parvularcula flava]|uniref:VOC family protein n=1 Tax=Aquisalinus luteolus TaxID=1566827 RepID=A0A8J3A1M3_9PROT|nr:VOC family protein [Aquisalinus luteolus]NHK27732.1 VOC family protein [Aquisalinus luteolus]GGH96332.1 hypothetical protein GCM10011355_14980 [Aquisalinus luteolus]